MLNGYTWRQFMIRTIHDCLMHRTVNEKRLHPKIDKYTDIKSEINPCIKAKPTCNQKGINNTEKMEAKKSNSTRYHWSNSKHSLLPKKKALTQSIMIKWTLLT